MSLEFLKEMSKPELSPILDQKFYQESSAFRPINLLIKLVG